MAAAIAGVISEHCYNVVDPLVPTLGPDFRESRIRDDEFIGYFEGSDVSIVQRTVKLWSHFFHSNFIQWGINDHEKKRKGRARLCWCYDAKKGKIVPGYILKSSILVCDRGGRPYDPLKNPKGKTQKKYKSRHSEQNTKKTGCKAKMNITHWRLFEDYELKNDASHFKKSNMMKKLSVAIANTNKCDERIITVMRLPLPNLHTGHLLTKENCMSRRKNPIVREKNQENVKSVGKYNFVHFPVRGRGEAIRMLLVDQGLDLEETSPGTWNNFLQTWKPKLTFGQLPALMDGDLMVCQFNAILRHLGRKEDLYGSSVTEATQIDVLNDGLEDLRTAYDNLIYRNKEGDEGKVKYIETLPDRLKPIEALLSASNAGTSGAAVGGKVSYVDYNLFDLCEMHVALNPACLEPFPALRAWHQIFEKRPKLAAYEQHTTMFVNKC